MYLPRHFAESRIEVMHRLMGERPLATLVTLGSTGLNANHLPMELDPAPAPFGTLRGHVARANPVWHDFSKNMDALVIFQGAQVYVSPSWYPTKDESGTVVPTYNYIVVHAYGPLRVIEERAWLRALVERLTGRFENSRAAPWRVDDAPADFIDKQLTAIVGIEIPIARILGKWKASQNRPMNDRAGVVSGLSEAGDADSQAMARIVKKRSQS